jgi:hypothetical protein
MTEKGTQEKLMRRLLFNKTGMAYKLRPYPDGKTRLFQTGTAIEPLDDAEEKALLDYNGVVFADTIMPATNGAEELAKAKKKVSELTEENRTLKESRAAEVAKASTKK